MLDIKKLEKSTYFKKRTLKIWEYLFKEWEKDENIYIVLVWELYIEKYTDINKNKSKKLANLRKYEVFWEASLNNNKPKQVSIKAKFKTELLYINATTWLEDFGKKNTIDAFNLLKYIIHLSNDRLNTSNNLITSNYEISNEIAKLKDFSYKTIFELIEKIKNISKIDEEIIYLKENPVLEQYLTIKYKTSKKWIMQNEVLKVTDNKLDLLNLRVKSKYSYTQNLKIWNKNYGYLIFVRKERDFSENEIKVFLSIWTLLAWVLKQKEFLLDQKNKDYIKNF